MVKTSTSQSFSAAKECENSENKEKNYIHKERRFSSMKRMIVLADASPNHISAKLDEGLLRIIVPKVEKTDNTKKIEIV